MFRFFLCLFAGLVLLMQAVQGMVTVTVNIDMQGPPDNTGSTGPLTYSGLGVAPDSGENTYWNAWHFSTPPAILLASDGSTVSGLTAGTNLTIGYGNIGFGGSTSALLQDRGILPSASPGAVTISGFAAFQEVDVYAYNGFYRQTYSIAGSGSESTNLLDATSNQATNPATFVEHEQYVFFDNATATAGGFLTIEFIPLAGPYGTADALAGLQLQYQVVPEPGQTAAGLGLLAGVVVLVFNRRGVG